MLSFRRLESAIVEPAANLIWKLLRACVYTSAHRLCMCVCLIDICLAHTAVIIHTYKHTHTQGKMKRSVVAYVRRSDEDICASVCQSANGGLLIENQSSLKLAITTQHCAATYIRSCWLAGMHACVASLKMWCT